MAWIRGMSGPKYGFPTLFSSLLAGPYSVNQRRGKRARASPDDGVSWTP